MRRAHEGRRMAGLQSETSVLRGEPERYVLPVLRELGIAYVAYSQVSRGLLTGRIRTPEDLSPDDWRRQVPRFQGDNLARNLTVVAGLAEVAAARGVDLATLSLAWLLAQGEDIVPLVGTSRSDHVADNLAALEVRLSPDDLVAIDQIAPVGVAAGNRYPDSYMPRLGL